MNNPANIVWMMITGTLFFIFLAVFIIYFVLFYRRKQLQNEIEKKNLHLKYNQELLASQLEIQEQLLRQVSSEIHDNLGQVAALIKINLLTFPKDLTPEAAHKLDQTTVLMKKLVADLKTLSVHLNTDYLENEGLFKVLEKEIDRINNTAIIHAFFSAVGYAPSMEKGKEIFLYRMVQELLSNAIKHANATELLLSVDGNEDELTITVKDNGTGFDPPKLENDPVKTSTGLLSLKKRCSLIGARFTIESDRALGSKATIYFPLNKKTEPND